MVRYLNARAATPSRALRHSSLRAALNSVALDLPDLMERAGKSEDRDYAYVSHEHVILHVRRKLLEHGVVVIPRELRFIEPVGAMLVWEQSFVVQHEHSAEEQRGSVQVTTATTEQAASRASTSADRIFLMRLCRLAAQSDQGDAQARSRQGVDHDPATGEVRRPRFTDVDMLVAELCGGLATIEGDEVALGKFHGAATGRLDASGATRGQRDRVKRAFVARCKSLGLDAKRAADLSTSQP